MNALRTAAILLAPWVVIIGLSIGLNFAGCGSSDHRHEMATRDCDPGPGRTCPCVI